MRAHIFATGALALLLAGCKKEPGEGGKSELRGHLYEQAYNDNTCQPIGEPYPLIDARVYIMYGDHDFHDDDTRTGPDGLFVFSWLRKGNYRVFTYGECDQDPDDCPSGFTSIQFSVTINDKDEVVTVPTMTAQNW